jgi:DNA-directed RNA polymerase specialized sigma24 family protein
MAGTGAVASIASVLLRRSRALVDATVPHVYGAALAAAVDPATAADVTREVMVEAANGRSRADARTLVERALLRSVRAAPHQAFASMRTEDREVVVLARRGGYTVGEIASTLAIRPAEVRARMTSGLRTLVSEGVR